MGLGTAATQNVGTAAGNVVQLDATTAKLPAVDGSLLTNVAGGKAHGQCILTLSSGSVKLAPKNGNGLIVNGVSCTVPDAGVTLAATGLTVSTGYFIYATASGGAVNALIASTTGHSVSTTAGNKGVEIMTGDETKTLVGWAYVVTGPAWGTSAVQVLSWFNRRHKAATTAFTASRSTTSTTNVEINTEIRNTFGTWADEAVYVAVDTNTSASTTGDFTSTQIAFDGTTPENARSIAQAPAAGANTMPGGFTFFKNGLAEGVHYATLIGLVGTSGTWLGDASAPQRTTLHITVKG
jgi:hypothetical protein